MRRRRIASLGPPGPEGLPEKITRVSDRESRATLPEEVLPGPLGGLAGFPSTEAEGPEGRLGHLHRLVLLLRTFGARFGLLRVRGRRGLRLRAHT